MILLAFLINYNYNINKPKLTNLKGDEKDEV